MSYRLRSELAYCHVGKRVFLLDLGVNRYFCLPANATDLFIKFTGGAELSTGEALKLKPLLEPADIDAHRARTYDGQPTSLDAVSASAYDRTLPAVTPVDLVAAVSCLGRSMIELRLMSLAWNVAQIRSLKNEAWKSETSSELEFGRTLSAFHRIDGYVSPLNRCLPRSLSLASRLLKQGCQVDLVFGIIDRPFYAHCWVQRGQTVLNDKIERVRDFTPILVV